MPGMGRIEVPTVYLSIHIHFYSFFLEARQRGRFAGFSLYVSYTDVLTHEIIQKSTLCYKDGPKLPPLNFTTNCTQYGRYVIFYNERLDRVTYPTGYEISAVFTELCEVIVKGDYILLFLFFLFLLRSFLCFFKWYFICLIVKQCLFGLVYFKQILVLVHLFVKMNPYLKKT